MTQNDGGGGRSNVGKLARPAPLMCARTSAQSPDKSKPRIANDFMIQKAIYSETVSTRSTSDGKLNR